VLGNPLCTGPIPRRTGCILKILKIVLLKMIPVETVSEIRGWGAGMKESIEGKEFKYDIFDTL
jgi:hypothetical protein